MDVSEPLHILKKLGKHIGQKSYKTQEMLRHGLTVHYAHRIYMESRLQKYPESRKSINPTHAFSVLKSWNSEATESTHASLADRAFLLILQQCKYYNDR